LIDNQIVYKQAGPHKAIRTINVCSRTVHQVSEALRSIRGHYTQEGCLLYRHVPISHIDLWPGNDIRLVLYIAAGMLHDRKHEFVHDRSRSRRNTGSDAAYNFVTSRSVSSTIPSTACPAEVARISVRPTQSVSVSSGPGAYPRRPTDNGTGKSISDCRARTHSNVSRVVDVVVCAQ